MLLLAFPPQRFRSMFKRYNLVPLVPKLDASVPIDSAPVDIIRAMTNTFLRATALTACMNNLVKFINEVHSHHTARHRQMEIHTNKEAERLIDKCKNKKQTDRQKGKETKGQIYKRTDRQTKRTDKQKDRYMDKKSDRMGRT